MDITDAIGQPLEVGDIILVSGASCRDEHVFPAFFKILSTKENTISGQIRAEAINKQDLLRSKGLCSNGWCRNDNVLKVAEHMLTWDADTLKLHIKVSGLINFIQE